MINKSLIKFSKKRTLINNMYSELKKDSLENYIGKHANNGLLLKKLLTFCYEHEINIHSYSLGSNSDPAYINFKYEIIHADFLSSLVAKLSTEDFCFVYMKETKSKLSLQIECSKNKATFFTKIHDALIDEESDCTISADLEHLEYILLEDNFDLPLQITYKKEKNEHMYSILTKVPHYVEYAKNMHFSIEKEDDFTNCLLISNSQSISNLKLRHFFEQIKMLNLNYDLLIALPTSRTKTIKDISKSELLTIYRQFLKDKKTNNTIALYQPITNPNTRELLFVHNKSVDGDSYKIIFSDQEQFDKDILPSLLVELKKDSLLLDDEFDEFSYNSNPKNNFHEILSMKGNKYIFGNFPQEFLSFINDELKDKKEESIPIIGQSKLSLLPSSGYTSPVGLIMGTIILSLSIILFALIITLLN